VQPRNILLLAARKVKDVWCSLTQIGPQRCQVSRSRISLVLFILGTFFYFLPGLIFTKPLLANRENSSRAVLNRDGGLVQVTLTGDEKYRLWTPLSEISPELIDATIRYEDRWFWYHPGINPFAILRAIGHNLTHTATRPIGGSTITMQLVRKRFRMSTRSFAGKLRQIGNALLIEYFYSKREILEAYLNTAPYGANIEGIGAAARIYYRIAASQLSLSQAQLLSLIPQNPGSRAPVNEGNRERLVSVGLRQDIGEVASKNIDTVFGTRNDLPKHAPHFVNRAVQLAGRTGEIKATLSAVTQRLIERALSRFIEQNRLLGFSNGTAMVVDSATMEVLAYVGSANYTDGMIQGFVNGLAAKRSPGSALKPFIYALAIDQGLITPETLLKDTPLRIANYHPENFERNFLGPLSATEALVRSRNIPAIELARSLKKPSLFDFFRNSGFSLIHTEEHYGLALALGSFEVSMEEVLAAYAMLADGGGRYRPLSWFGPSTDEGTQLLSPESAYLVYEMLKKNPRPHQLFGAHSFNSHQSVAWKTGTSFGAKDAWAIGIVDSLVVGVWLGNFDAAPNPNFIGRDAAGPLLFSIIDGVRAELPPSPSRRPLPRNLKLIELCALSGAPAGPHCPHRRAGWIVPGVSPIRSCSVHREILIDTATGLRICDGPQQSLLQASTQTAETLFRREVYEVWDTDLLRLFHLAGLSRKTPPPFHSLCATPDRADAIIRPPRITSPQEGISYQLRPNSATMVELSAIADGGRRTLYWFVNDQFVGEGTSVMWQARPGDFLVRVVDDQGQGEVRQLRVVWASG